jgi:hypothetical protein
LQSFYQFFNGEKMNIDSSVWLDKLKKEIIAGKYSRRTIEIHSTRALWLCYALPKPPSAASRRPRTLREIFELKI